MSELDQATVKKTTAESDALYIDRGVLDPDEVALSRFGSGKYSTETTIDVEARETEEDDPLEGKPTSGAAGDLSDVQTTALNGAQVASLIETVGQVARGELPRDAAVEILMRAYQVERSVADRMLGSAGRGFKPERPEPTNTPPAPKAGDA